MIDSPQLTQELDRILSSKAFAGSPILSRFLSFVVNEKLAGREHLIKEYTIATEVLGRKDQFLNQADASVRIHAIRLRKLLDEYYYNAGPEIDIRIEIPKGRYQPVFSYLRRTEIIEEKIQPQEIIPEDSICIVPFAGFINNELFDFSPVGFCEYLSEKLSHFQDISVLSLQSVIDHVQDGGKVQDLGEKFRVTYYLTGSLEIDETNILVSVQLYDANTNSFIWSHDFPDELKNNSITDIVESITSKIVSSLAGYSGYLHYKNFNAVDHLPPMSNKVANAVFWFYRYQSQHSEQVFYEAISQLERVVQEAPDCSLCLAVLAHLYADGVFYNYQTVPDPLSRSRDYVDQALALDPNCQHAYIAQTWNHILLRNKAEATNSIRKCYSINPNSSFFVSVCSLGNTLLGDYDVALEMYEKTINLNPLPYWWMNTLKIFLAFKKDNYQEALFHAQKKGTPKVIYEYVFEMIASYHLNDKASLEKYIQLHQKKFPGSIEYVSKALQMVIFDQEVNDRLTQAFEYINGYISRHDNS